MREIILWSSFFASAASYVGACALFLKQARRRGERTDPGWAMRLLGAGAIFQLLYLIAHALVGHRCPVYSLHSALGIVSLVAVISYALFRHRRRLEALGSFVAAFAALVLVTTRFLAEDSPPLPGDRWLMALHITSNLLGTGLVLVAGCASAFYLWNEMRLRHRRSLGHGTKLPPLESLDVVIHRLLWTGLPLLTIGLFTGRMVIKQLDVVTMGDHVRAVVSGASWMVLIIVLALRQIAGWRGRKPAYATLGGAVGILTVIVLYVLRSIVGDTL